MTRFINSFTDSSPYSYNSFLIHKVVDILGTRSVYLIKWQKTDTFLRPIHTAFIKLCISLKSHPIPVLKAFLSILAMSRALMTHSIPAHTPHCPHILKVYCFPHMS